MSALQPFVFDDAQVRVDVDDEGMPWFVASDVARILGYRDAFNVARRVDADDRGTRLVSTPSGDQTMTVVSEPGLYVAVLGSQVNRARDFKRWITHDVLPALRRTGTYSVPQQQPRELSRLELIDRLAETASLARESELGRLRAEAHAEALMPSATSWDALAAAQGDWSLREAAQVLSRDHGIDTGQNRLAQTLREIGWTDRAGTPYQRHITAGRLVQRATSYSHPVTGERVATTQLRVTPKGLGRLRELLAPSGQVVLAGEHTLTAVPS